MGGTKGGTDSNDRYGVISVGPAAGPRPPTKPAKARKAGRKGVARAGKKKAVRKTAKKRRR